jgi:hypothetical protein
MGMANGAFSLMERDDEKSCPLLESGRYQNGASSTACSRLPSGVRPRQRGAGLKPLHHSGKSNLPESAPVGEFAGDYCGHWSALEGAAIER